MYVFRDGRKTVTGQRLLRELRGALEALDRVATGSPLGSLIDNDSVSPGERVVTLPGAESKESLGVHGTDHQGHTNLGTALPDGGRPTPDRILDALIAAGELECALTDADSAEATRAAKLTDATAEMLLGLRPCGGRELLRDLETIAAPAELHIAVHEGFAYYALHPLKIRDLLRHLPVPDRAVVVGIRSIGVTLSAVLSAALRERGCTVERRTVRPGGHPYDRQLTLSPDERQWIQERRGCQFMIIDEGPGLSGSSFLSVAEALVENGVSHERVLLIGSREADSTQLRSPGADERWRRFRFACLASHPYIPEGAAIAIGGGGWRREFLTDFSDQPASWTQLEMAKFLSADRRLLYKFEGFGHFGGEIGRRAAALAANGLGPRYLGNESGFGIYEVNRGRMLRREDLSPALLRHMALYCAFRAREFDAGDRQASAIDEMAPWNWSLEFGGCPWKGNVEVTRRTICDARMMPHEWLQLPDGSILKLDGVAHGDDHFFPGPCDIAWDLAGTIVEWKLQASDGEYFLQQYEEASGDNARARLPGYLHAYLSFRLGWCKMAALASQGSFDEALLTRDYCAYRSHAQTFSTTSGIVAREVIELGINDAEPEADATRRSA